MKRCQGLVVILIALGGLWGLAACAAGGATCGDRTCDPGEDSFTCPTDCSPSVCGDLICTAGESTTTCPGDCYCGNGTCDLGENLSTCVADCGAAVCGDGVCAAGENQALCPGDCYCGNGSCDTGETEQLCPADCGAGSCPDGTCQTTETTASCPGDCFCGNGSCDGGENVTLCSEDCTEPTCGDGSCDAPLEDATNCPADCGESCIDSVCDFWPQCGCQSGDKCTINDTDDRECLTAGSTPHAQLCAADADCVAGTICVGTSVQDLRCHQFCGSDADCPGSGGGGVCIVTLEDSSSQTIPGATLCTTDCEPTSTSPPACPTGWACHLQYVDANNDDIPEFFLTDCANDAGSAVHGEYCDNVTALCAPGHFCYTTFNECIRTCRVLGSDCPVGYSCQAYTAPGAVVGTTEYGYCD